MTSKELVMQALNKRRLPICEEAENTIVTRYQMSYIQIGSLKDDTKAMAVSLSGIFTADNDTEMRLGLKVCNTLNYTMMQVKLYIDSDNDLTIAAEFFYAVDDDVEPLLDIAMRSLLSAKKRFLREYEEAEAEEKLLRDIEEE